MIKKKTSSEWFSKVLQNNICSELEILEKNYSDSNCKFKIKQWKRDKNGLDDLGGGEMRVMRGKYSKKQVLMFQQFMVNYLIN